MIRAVVTDIEGTTSSLSFVKDTLFPYARERLPAFVRRHAAEPAVAELLDEVRREAGDETLDLEGVIARLQHWIDQDRKIAPLKALQGMIWAQGYAEGDFRGHVYPDAARRLRQWRAEGLRLFVFSSGSVQAQELLFRHTPEGDLWSLFEGGFDTRIGAKRDPGAYRRIAETIGLPPGEILFLSDVEAELDAAREAGMHTLWLVREGRPDPRAGHRQVSSFDDIDPATVAS